MNATCLASPSPQRKLAVTLGIEITSNDVTNAFLRHGEIPRIRSVTMQANFLVQRVAHGNKLVVPSKRASNVELLAIACPLFIGTHSAFFGKTAENRTRPTSSIGSPWPRARTTQSSRLERLERLFTPPSMGFVCSMCVYDFIVHLAIILYTRRRTTRD